MLSNSPDELILLTEQYGYGQLTTTGKQRGYELGEYIRSRYNELLSPQYNRSEIFIRSTDSTRTKMTILTAMAAVYPAGDHSWSRKINWAPTPYTTVPVLYDFNVASLNCPNFVSAYLDLLLTPVSTDIEAQYSEVLNVLSNATGINITQVPAITYAIYDVYTSQKSLGIPLTSEVEEIWPQVEALAGIAIDIVFGNEDYIKLQAGVLLNEFFTKVDQIISGDDIQRVQVYSAHDFNVYSFEAVTQVPRQGVPKYGSAYSLELRRVKETGQYVVLPVYLDSPGEEPKYLQVKGCDLLCDINQFKEITAPYTLDYEEWQTQCAWTKDQVIDDSSIA